MNELKKQFLFGDYKPERAEGFGPASAWLLQIDDRDLFNRSNMMQGILHYTSSLLHAIYAHFRRETFKSLVDNVVAYTAMVSSDDFGDIISVESGSRSTKSELIKLCGVNQALLNLSKHFCIRVSTEKSTIGGFYRVFEFNSVFYSMSSQIIPTIKFVHSAMTLKHKSRMEDVLSSCANVLKQVVESGGSMLMSYTVEMCQARLHYLSMGALTNPLFAKYAELLCDAPHPSLGYFPMQSLPGVLGYEQAKWTLWNDRRCLRADAALRQLYQQNVDGTGLAFDVTFRFGKGVNHQRFLDSIRPYYSEVEGMSVGLEWYFRTDLNRRETLYRIKCQAEGSDAVDAMSRDNMSKVMRAGVYKIENKVLTIRSDDEQSKTSIIGLLSRIVAFAPMFDADESKRQILFPLHHYYSMAYDSTSQLSGRAISINEPRRVISKVTVNPTRASYCPLISTIRFMWFNQQQVQSEADIRSSFRDYQELYPWMKDEGPSENHPHKTDRSLASFIMSHDKFEKTIEVIAPFKVGNVTSLITNCVKYMMYRGKVMVARQAGETSFLTGNLPKIHDKMILILFNSSKPAMTLIKDSPLERLDPDQLQEVMDAQNFSDEQRKTLTMAYLAKFGKKEYLESMWKHMRRDTVFFPRPQTKVGGAYEGHGTAKIVLSRSESTITMYLRDDVITNILLPSNFRLRERKVLASIARVKRNLNLVDGETGSFDTLTGRNDKPKGLLMTIGDRAPWSLSNIDVRRENERIMLFDGQTEVLRSLPSLIGGYSGESVDKHLDAWSNKKSLNLEPARRLILEGKNEGWLKASFKARYSQTPKVAEISDIEFGIIDDLMDMSDLLDTLDAEVAPDAMDDITITEINKLMQYEEEQPMTLVERGIYASVPYWDPTIKYCMSMGLNRMIESQTKVVLADPAMMKILSWYGNDEKPEAPVIPVIMEESSWD